MFPLIILIWISLVNSSLNLKDNNGFNLTVPQIIMGYGYPCEEYKVTTPDGYILTLHRIPNGKTNKTLQQVVYLQHGLHSSSADWIITGPSYALGYILADQGYDVWMGNARGNKLSRNHIYLNPDTSAQFWDFSWHEIGYYDVPTMIDFILEKTGNSSLFHIGHSQGTTSFYVMTSLRPDYNAKIKAHFSLAPIAFISHMNSFFMHLFARLGKQIGFVLNSLGIREISLSTTVVAALAKKFCADNSLTQPLCKDALTTFYGFSYEELNVSFIPAISWHTPAGASVKQLLHYAQQITSNNFRQYDYGFFTNMQKYGSLQPPDYDLRNIVAPVYLIWSYNDRWNSEIDVNKLCHFLRNCQGKFLVQEKTFKHYDYIFGINTHTLVYDGIIKLMADYKDLFSNGVV